MNTVQTSGGGGGYTEDDIKELVVTAPSQRNWLGIILALLVISFIFAMIVIAAVVMTKQQKSVQVQGRLVSLQDITHSLLQAPTFNGSWMSDHEVVYGDVEGGLSVLDCRTLQTRSIVSNFTFRQWHVHSFVVSPDRKYVLLAHDYVQVHRYSFLARYTAYDIARGTSVPVTPTPDTRGHPRVSWVNWVPTDDPDNARGHALVMIYRGDIYYQQDAGSAGFIDRVTSTAQQNTVTNGAPDWLYEEEILMSNTALWFNKKGSSLVYASFNDSLVEQVPLVSYNSRAHTNNNSSITWMRYPKAGSINPTVTLWVVNLLDLTSPPPRDLKPPSELIDSEYYVNDVVWVSDGTVAVTWMNRAQNSSYISLCPTSLGYCSQTHVQERAVEGGWLDRQLAPVYSQSGDSYLAVVPVRDASSGTFSHISRHDSNPRRMAPLTIGPMNVQRILAWHEQANMVYFIGSPASVEETRHLYRTNSTSASYKSQPQCLTCRSNISQHFCSYVDIIMSPGSDYYIETCLGPSVPWTRVFSLPHNKYVLNITDYPELRRRVAQVALPQVEVRSVPLSHGFNASVKLLLPPGFSKFSDTTYPVLLNIYAGPGSRGVTSRWTVDWATYMTSGRGYVTVLVDASGSRGRGHLIEQRVHGRLGQIEVIDQITVLKQLLESEYYLDPERVIVYGWSFGGFAAAMALAKDKQRMFSGAIAIAPVTDWTLYDSAYTEKYLGQPGPQGNYRGYEEADLNKMAAKLQGRHLMLIHGSRDDNVHVQHSMQFSRSLVMAGVQFTQQIYPDEDHTLSGVQEHLFTLMENFSERCFLPPADVVKRALAKYFKKRIAQ